MSPARLAVLALAFLLVTACSSSSSNKRKRTWRVEPAKPTHHAPAVAKHKSHEHPHGAHPHGASPHHHHPHPHPHLAGPYGHHHPY